MRVTDSPSPWISNQRQTTPFDLWGPSSPPLLQGKGEGQKRQEKLQAWPQDFPGSSALPRTSLDMWMAGACAWMCAVTSVVSDSLWPYGPESARLLCPWDSPGKNSGMGSHALPQRIFPTQELNLHLFRLLALADRFFTTSETREAPSACRYNWKSLPPSIQWKYPGKSHFLSSNLTVLSQDLIQ